MAGPEEDGLLVFRNGKWVAAPKPKEGEVTKFREIMWYYGNIIDYARVALCILAAFTLSWDLPFLTAFLIMTSILLDWLDGPVARYFNQCTLFGSGVDWLADVQAQIITAMWWASLDKRAAPWILTATTIELATCIWDYAQTATMKYPTPAKKSGLMIIIEWATPGGVYTNFGTFLWLAYPIWCLSHCLDLSWPVRSELTGNILLFLEYSMFIPSILYIWNEAAQLALILQNWTEPKRNYKAPLFVDDAAGFSVLDVTPKDKQDLISTMFEHAKKKIGLDKWEQRLATKEIFWINLAQRNGIQEIWKDAPGINELNEWVLQLFKTWSNEEEDLLDGFGFITNPVGSRTQSWHLDYGVGYSSIFIPITPVTPENATQYFVLPENVPQDLYQKYVADSPDEVKMEELLKGSDWISVRQMIGKPFSILRMNFKCIHRGISNRGDFPRTIFWISVRKKNSPLSPIESPVQDFENDIVLAKMNYKKTN